MHNLSMVPSCFPSNFKDTSSVSTFQHSQSPGPAPDPNSVPNGTYPPNI
jgi:hypothetical protein